MERAMNKCNEMETRLAEMLLVPESVPAEVATHVAACAACSHDLNELRATMALMDSWKAPEPNPYFMTQFNARLAEERKAAPAGWFERLRSRYLFGPQLHARPLAAMALTVVLLLGGGTYLSLSSGDQPVAAPPQAAVVHDLQVLDNNSQVLEQLESISATDDPGSAVN